VTAVRGLHRRRATILIFILAATLALLGGIRPDQLRDAAV
jgi:hypothetical protein